MKTDAQLKDDVLEELRWDPQISDADAIGVGVKDGAVILSGHVPSYAEKLAAAQAAERVNGVKLQPVGHVPADTGANQSARPTQQQQRGRRRFQPHRPMRAAA